MNNTKRIVVIDDDVDHLEVSKLILQHGGYDVLILDDCDELVDRIRLFRPDLIIMDHTMPTMTGAEAMRLIKSNTECTHIPVIYFTNREDVRKLAALAGADDWLSKPFNLDDMVNKARKFF
jgi:two-component system cell cycle response regulator DivK